MRKRDVTGSKTKTRKYCTAKNNIIVVKIAHLSKQYQSSWNSLASNNSSTRWWQVFIWDIKWWVRLCLKFSFNTVFREGLKKLQNNVNQAMKDEKDVLAQQNVNLS